MYIRNQEMSQIRNQNSHLKKLGKGKDHYKHKVSQRTKINDSKANTIYMDVKRTANIQGVLKEEVMWRMYTARYRLSIKLQ